MRYMTIPDPSHFSSSSPDLSIPIPSSRPSGPCFHSFHPTPSLSSVSSQRTSSSKRIILPTSSNSPKHALTIAQDERIGLGGRIWASAYALEAYFNPENGEKYQFQPAPPIPVKYSKQTRNDRVDGTNGTNIERVP